MNLNLRIPSKVAVSDQPSNWKLRNHNLRIMGAGDRLVKQTIKRPHTLLACFLSATFMRVVRRILKYRFEKASNEESNGAPTCNTVRMIPQI
jgi:hypothetical protein